MPCHRDRSRAPIPAFGDAGAGPASGGKGHHKGADDDDHNPGRRHAVVLPSILFVEFVQQQRLEVGVPRVLGENQQQTDNDDRGAAQANILDVVSTIDPAAWLSPAH